MAACNYEDEMFEESKWLESEILCGKNIKIYLFVKKKNMKMSAEKINYIILEYRWNWALNFDRNELSKIKVNEFCKIEKNI